MIYLDVDQEKLYKDNIRIAYYAANKWYPKIHKGNDSRYQYTKDEIESECLYGFLKSVKAYDASKGVKLITFSMKCIDNQILMLIRKNKKNVENMYLPCLGESPEYDIYELISNCKQLNTNNVEEFVNLECLKCVINDLSDMEKEIINLKLIGLNQVEIGIKKGLSQSYISRLISMSKTKISRALAN